jgi:Zn-dependent protease with chaperone function
MVSPTGLRPITPAGRTPSQTGPILGMYALLATAVGCVGASAGQLFFAGDGTLSTPFEGAQNRCFLSYPIAIHLQELDRCQEGSYRSQGLFVLGCAASMLLIMAALILVVPSLDRRRLARALQFTESQGIPAAATARFGSFCDQAGLTGRRRPRLVVAAVPEAFTTALPGGLPLVVIPVQIVLARDYPSRFDPVVLHELAHVRARDVSLVSSVRGIAWITIPVLALASLPEFLDAGQTQVQRAYLLQAVGFVAATILVAAGLLRVREIAADRQAARWLGSPETLQNLLDSAEVPVGTRPHRSSRRRFRLLARHPSLLARLTALRSPLTDRDAGFATALTVGAVAAMAMNTCFYFASSLDSAAAVWLPIRVWAATGGVVLGLGLAPAFLRSAAQARRAGEPFAWWTPVAGVSFGLLLGSLVAPGLATGAVISVVVGSGFRGVATAVLLALTGAGIAVLTAGLASLAADRYPHRPSWLAACVTAVTACWTAAALLPVRGLFSTGIDSHSVVFSLAGNQWRLLLLLYPAAVIALGAPIRSREGHGPAADANQASTGPRSMTSSPGAWTQQARVAVSLAITPVCAAVIATAILLTQRHLGDSTSEVVVSRWSQENWWVCAITGWVVLVILALARGIPGLARACFSGWLTTLLVCVGNVAYEALVRGGPFVHLLSLWTPVPSAWLFYLALPTSLLALVRIRRPAPLKQSWLMPASASAAAAAAAALVFVTGIPGLLGETVAATLSSPCGNPQPVSVTSDLSPALDTHQVLTKAAAHKAIAGFCAALPAGWISGTPTGTITPTERETIRPVDCTRLDAQQYLDVVAHPLTQAQDDYQIAPASLMGSETLGVQVNSYSGPVPSSLFATANRDLASCPHYAVAQPSGTLLWAAQRFSMQETGVHVWGVDLSTYLQADGGLVGETITRVIASIGHDLIIVNQQTIAQGMMRPPPNRAVIAAALTATIAAFRQTVISPVQACREVRTATITLGHEIIGSYHGYSSAQLADYRQYGATLVHLGVLISRSGSNSGLARVLVLVGAESSIIGTAPDLSAEQLAALNEISNLGLLVRKACVAIGAWPK